MKTKNVVIVEGNVSAALPNTMFRVDAGGRKADFGHVNRENA